MEKHKALEKNILIVEDENHLSQGLKLNLELVGHKVALASDGIQGLEAFEKGQFDLVILDLMMPKLDGVHVLKAIRKTNEKIPVLILSAKNRPEDRVNCFELGVDDYLCKPFHLDELILRVGRLLDRSSWNGDLGGQILGNKGKVEATPDQYQFGQNTIDFIRYEANTAKGTIGLTGQELKILKLFIENKNRPLSREELLEKGWGYEKGISTRTVDNFLVRFRKYFEEDPKGPVYFKSLRSVGYVFEHK